MDLKDIQLKFKYILLFSKVLESRNDLDKSDIEIEKCQEIYRLNRLDISEDLSLDFLQ